MHLTPREEEIMEVFWNTQTPITQAQLIEQCTNKSWQDRSVFSLINSLMRKGLVEEVGFVRAGKTYARTFGAAMTQAEWWAHCVATQIPESEYPAFLKALNERRPLSKEQLDHIRAIVDESLASQN